MQFHFVIFFPLFSLSPYFSLFVPNSNKLGWGLTGRGGERKWELKDMVLRKQIPTALLPSKLFIAFLFRFTTSCLDGSNIDAPFQFIGDMVLREQIPMPNSNKKDTIRISNDVNAKPAKKKPCCSAWSFAIFTFAKISRIFLANCWRGIFGENFGAEILAYVVGGNVRVEKWDFFCTIM